MQAQQGSCIEGLKGLGEGAVAPFPAQRLHQLLSLLHSWHVACCLEGCFCLSMTRKTQLTDSLLCRLRLAQHMLCGDRDRQWHGQTSAQTDSSTKALCRCTMAAEASQFWVLVYVGKACVYSTPATISLSSGMHIS